MNIMCPLPYLGEPIMNPSRGELEHIPVLKTSVLDYLITDRGGTYVDCTIGGGGHAQVILEQLGESGVLIGLDLDAHAVEVTQRRLSHFGDKLSVFQTDFSALKKTLEEHGDKISDADKSAIEAAVEDLKSTLEGEDTQAITDKTNALAQASMKLGEALYQESQAEAGDPEELNPDDTGGSSQADDDVVDADFEEVSEDDDDKKSA